MQNVIKKVAKHFRLDENLIKDAQKILKTKTETEAVETALSEVIYQEKMRKFIERTYVNPNSKPAICNPKSKIVMR